MMNKNTTIPPAQGGGNQGFGTSRKSKCKNDLIFIGILLTVLILAGLAFFFLREEGDRVRVTVNGEYYGIYSLSEDIEIDIRTGKNGEQLNRLVIREGRAFVESATCPDGICSDHRPISKDGESIVCLPHKVVVAVEQQ
jgi:hypothetical protein